MGEYVQVLRAIWRCWKTGEKPAFEGRHYRFTLMTPNFAPEPIAAPPPAVMIAAVGPAMLRVAAEECDGVKLHGFCTRQYLTDEIMPRVEAGLTKAGRPRAQYEISGGGFLATGPDDESVAKRFEWVRQRVAFYGSTPAYYPVFAMHGLEDLGLKLNALVRQGKWNEMAQEVPDEVAHLFAAVGRHAQILGAIPQRFRCMSAAAFPATWPGLPIGSGRGAMWRWRSTAWSRAASPAAAATAGRRNRRSTPTRRGATSLSRGSSMRRGSPSSVNRWAAMRRF